MCVSAHTCAHGGQSWAERDWDPDGVLTSLMDYHTDALIADGAFGRMSLVGETGLGLPLEGLSCLQPLPLF